MLRRILSPVCKSLDWQAIWSLKRSDTGPLVAQKTGVDNFAGCARIAASMAERVGFNIVANLK
jgi:hypothetical protein